MCKRPVAGRSLEYERTRKKVARVTREQQSSRLVGGCKVCTEFGDYSKCYWLWFSFFFKEHPSCLCRDHCVSSVPRMKSTTQQVLANLLPNQRTHISVHSQVPNEATPHLSLAFFKILSLSKNKVFLAAAGT